jgi:hypothetical protein
MTQGPLNMFFRRHHGSLLLPLTIFCACTTSVAAADSEIIIEDDVVIESNGAESADSILIEETPGQDELMIEESDPAAGDGLMAGGTDTDESLEAGSQSGDLEIKIDDAWAEYGHFTRSDSESDNSLYGKVAASANWQPNSSWELQLAGRIDGYDEDGKNSFTDIVADYGDSYIRYRTEDLKLTFGTQTVVWGRLDELPLADRVSRADLTRFVLDDLEDRRRANPVIRAEAFFGSGKLDLVWLYDFRGAALPDKDSVWYPVNRETGRIIGFDPDDIPPASIKNARISDKASSGDGGFGARYTRTHSFADIGFTVAHTRQSTPYYRSAGIGRIEALYPRSWAYGADAAVDAAGATWRAELLYSSDNPVTRENLGYTTTPAMSWGAGVEFHPGDSDTRVNLQLVGMNLIDSPSIIDRKEVYSVNGEVETPFDRERWRAKLGFYAGMKDKDIYLNPEIAFLGWEPHEVYLALHYFEGDDDTFSGFHEDHSSINLGWRATF